MISPDIGGTMIRSLATCKTQLWYFSHGINLDYDNEHILVGREIHKSGFARYLKERETGPIKIDIMKKHMIVEIKKSSSNLIASIWQTKYYIWYMKKMRGVDIDAKIYIPSEKRSIKVTLEHGDSDKIKKMIEEIERITSLESPPSPEKKPICRGCSYYDLCWS